jgi:hypothetical protein
VKFDGEIGVMNKKFCAVIAAATLSLASQAPAAVINFSNAGTGASGATGISGITYLATAAWGANPFPTGSTSAVVGVGPAGLGVVGAGVASSVGTPETTFAGLGRRIDGVQAGSWEMLTITFIGGAVDLTNFVLGLMDPDDDFEYCFNACASFTTVAAGVPLGNTAVSGQESRTYAMNMANVTSFSIRATGAGGDILDDFTLLGANVSAVPLPAGAPLLLAGLAGLAALRRRKKAA